MIRIPGQQKTIPWSQLNLGDSQGALWATLNCDLTSKRGKLRISPRLLKNVDSNDLANLGVLAAARFFTTSSAKIWAICGARIFTSDAGPQNDFIQDATASSPTDCNADNSDMELYETDVSGSILPALFVTRASTSVSYLESNGTWSSFTAGSSSSGLRKLCRFLAQDRMYMTHNNGSEIISWDKERTVATVSLSSGINQTQYTLKVADGSFLKITHIMANSSRIWVLTVNETGRQGFVFAWDGSVAAGPNEVYVLESAGALSGVIKDDVPYIFDVKGRMLKFNGGSFVSAIDSLPETKLPFDGMQPKSYFTTATNRYIHHNGMAVIEGRIQAFINAQLWDTNSTIKENIASGIYELDPELGLYHKGSIGLSDSGDTIVDYGQQKINLIGALVEMDIPSNNFTQGSTNGKLICGCKYYLDGSNTRFGLFYNDTNDTKQKAGGFITSKFYSLSIEDAWEEFIARHRKFLDSEDKLIVKYRTEEMDSVEGDITWQSTNVILVSASFDYEEGDEVEIIQGIGSSKSAMITAIEDVGGGSYYLTLDQTFTGISVNDTGKARFQKWKFLALQEDLSAKHLSGNVGSSDSWVQFKCWLLLTGKGEIEDITLNQAIYKTQ